MTIENLQEKYDLQEDDFWQRGTTWIIKHDAITRIAEKEGIIFEKPEVHNFGSMVAFVGYGVMGDKRLWATGEASNDNVSMKGKYLWSMAEKRLQDRLTLKLIRAYEYGVYSDEEAKSFEHEEVLKEELAKIKAKEVF